MSFPESLDSIGRASSGDRLNQPNHREVHDAIADAIEALETKIGIDESDDEASIDFRVRALEDAPPSHTHVFGETPTGLVNGVNAEFTLNDAPSPSASLMLFLNGVLQRADGNDFTLADDEITFVMAPATGSVLVAHYVV